MQQPEHTFSFPVSIFWRSGTNPECNSVVATFDNKDALNYVFPQNVNYSFLADFIRDNFVGVLNEDGTIVTDHEPEAQFIDLYNNYFARLRGEQALAAIKELNEIIDRDELFCEDSFHIL